MAVMRQRAWSILGVGLLGTIALSGCGTPSATPVEHKNDPAAAHASVVESLQRQINERDKRIEELESRLGALKIIDLDIERQRKFSRPPATLKPAN
jgi:hypothetical protein